MDYRRVSSRSKCKCPFMGKVGKSELACQVCVKMTRPRVNDASRRGVADYLVVIGNTVRDILSIQTEASCSP